MPKDGHYVTRIGWLRAAVLGANDGIVSTASLLLGVIAAGMDRTGVLTAGFAGLAAGAFSMAAGEYVSVGAQADSERADLERERVALDENPDGELRELAEGLETRGVTPPLALQVARQMTYHDALDAHAREELGLALESRTRPLQAAFASAAAFAVGASLPLGAVIFGPLALTIVPVVSLLALVGLGAFGAWVGGAPAGRGVRRTLLWGAMAMALTAAIGHVFGLAL